MRNVTRRRETLNSEKGEAGTRKLPAKEIMKGKAIATKAVLTALILTMVLACGATATYAKSKKKKKEKYRLNEERIELNRNEKAVLKLTNSKGKPVKATKVKWSSANKKVAKVSKKGVVTGTFTGKGVRSKKRTFIYAKYKGKTYACSVWVNRKKYSKKAEKPKSFSEILKKNGNFDVERKAGLASSLADGKQKVVRSGCHPANVFKQFVCDGLTFTIAGNVWAGEDAPKPLLKLNGKTYMPFVLTKNGSQDYTYDLFYDKNETTYYGERFQLLCDKEDEYNDEGSSFMHDARTDFKKRTKITCDKCPTYDEQKAKRHKTGEKCVVTYGSYGTLILKCLNFEVGDAFTLTVEYRGVTFSVPCLCVET